MASDKITKICLYCNRKFFHPKARVKCCSRSCGRKSRAVDPTGKRFWRYVIIAAPNECWVWTGAKNRHGYGVFNCSVARLAHRMSYYIAYGQIGGLYVLHRCDNPPCVNPAHLFAGTQLDNCADRDSKNRVAHGSNHYASKISESQAVAIFKASGSQQSIASEYGVCQQTVGSIKSGRSWARATMSLRD